jgi:hypothetical protein
MPQYKDGKKFVRKRGTYIGNAKRRAEVKSMSKGPLKKPTSIKPTSIKPTSIKPPLGKPNSVKNLLPLANLNNAISGSNTVTNIKKYIVKKVKGSSDNSVLGVPLETSVKAGEKIAKNLKNTVNSGRNLYGAITEKSNAERMKGDLTKGISLFKYITGIANAKINKPKNKYEERKNRPVVSSEEYKKQYAAAIDPSFKAKLRRKMKSNDSIKYRFNGKFTD